MGLQCHLMTVSVPWVVHWSLRAGGGNSLQQTWRFKAVQHETHGAVGCLLLSWSLTRSPVPQHKKLAEGSAYEELPTSVMYSENDISNSIKNGILYLEDPIDHVRISMQ